MMFKLATLGLCVLSYLTCVYANEEVDPQGYILYCPCMGRFGNQLEQFLGALSFAKAVDRTLVVAPFVEYKKEYRNAVTEPFKSYFRLELLLEYHRVVAMEDFMADLAPTIWPEDQRIVFCYGPRKALKGSKDDPESCNAKDGNPFGPFWDSFSIDFVESNFYGPLNFEINNAAQWKKKYPGSTYPVIAFTGTPGSFPVKEPNVALHQYITWSDAIMEQANSIIEKHLQRPYVGAHLRIGSDWENACRHITSDRHLFGSPQCTGYRFEYGRISKAMCFPTDDEILKDLMHAVAQSRAKHVYVATDTHRSDRLNYYKQQLNKIQVTMVLLPDTSPQVDLAILELSDHYIANCVSTFSAIATRARRVHGKQDNTFWAMKPLVRDEL